MNENEIESVTADDDFHDTGHANLNENEYVNGIYIVSLVQRFYDTNHANSLSEKMEKVGCEKML